jgi:hypothetical protein
MSVNLHTPRRLDENCGYTFKNTSCCGRCQTPHILADISSALRPQMLEPLHCLNWLLMRLRAWPPWGWSLADILESSCSVSLLSFNSISFPSHLRALDTKGNEPRKKTKCKKCWAHKTHTHTATRKDLMERK